MAAAAPVGPPLPQAPRALSHPRSRARGSCAAAGCEDARWLRDRGPRAARAAGTMSRLGTVIGGRYRLEAEIGRGGMSSVYRAFDTVLERPVAIKMMHREIAADADQLERFRREARSVAQLNHPHVVTVIDAGEEPSGETDAGLDGVVGTPYIVLELIEGETLKDVIRRDAPLDIPQAIAYAIEIARALGAAHERQIV